MLESEDLWTRHTHALQVDAHTRLPKTLPAIQRLACANGNGNGKSAIFPQGVIEPAPTPCSKPAQLTILHVLNNRVNSAPNSITCIYIYIIYILYTYILVYYYSMLCLWLRPPLVWICSKALAFCKFTIPLDSSWYARVTTGGATTMTPLYILNLPIQICSISKVSPRLAKRKV